MRVRQMLPFILLNIVVSAVVVLAVLYWWDGRSSDEADPLALATPLPTFPPATATSQGGQPEVERPPAQAEESNPNVYVVQAGDTLGTISLDLDIAMDELMAANGLTDPNFLQVGQRLVLPGGEPVAEEAADQAAEAAAEDSPAVVPTPIEAILPTDGEAIIEIGGVASPGALLDEAVSIRNSGERPVALLGWRLEDEQGHVYTFGQVTLFGEGAAILVHSRSGQEGPADLFWGQGEPVWQTGETVTLADAEGDIRATFLIGDD